MRTVAQVVFLVATSQTVLAAGVPQFDTIAYCKQESQIVGGSYYQIEKACRDDEHSALVTLKFMNVPPKILSYCTQVANAIGGSYQVMNACVRIVCNRSSCGVKQK